LKQLSELLAAKNNRPVLSIARLPTSSKKELQRQIPHIKKEAAIYGWQH
jgi:predicted site-specific integrase-resolvase